MAKRQRIALIDHTPSTVVLVKHGGRETEKLLLEGDGLNVMINEDNTISIEVYTDSRSIVLRLSADDCKDQAHVLKRWGY